MCKECVVEIQNGEIDILDPGDHPISIYLREILCHWADKNSYLVIPRGNRTSHGTCPICDKESLPYSVTLPAGVEDNCPSLEEESSHMTFPSNVSCENVILHRGCQDGLSFTEEQYNNLKSYVELMLSNAYPICQIIFHSWRDFPKMTKFYLINLLFWRLTTTS